MEKNTLFSKFNTYVKNDFGEVIVYNSLNELEQFRKIRKEDSDLFMQAVSQKNTMLLPERLINDLKNYSFIIDSHEDELKKLEYMRLRVITQVQQKNVLGITIIPTGKCNFRCEYCYENFSNGKMTKYIQDAIIGFIRKRIIYHSGVSISWFGGEPLLELDIINYISKKVIEICDSLKRTYFASITTNGYLLTADVMKQLISNRIFSYQITLDGIPEIHNKYRHLSNGLPTFEKIEANLFSIKNTIKTGSIRICLRCNFTQESFSTLNDFSKWYISNFGDDNRFSIFIRTVGVYDNGGKNMSSVMMPDDGVGCVCSKIFELHGDNNSNCSCHMSNINFLSPGSCVCYAGLDNNFVFDSVGKVRKCTVALTEDYNIVGEVIDGEVYIDTIALARWVVPQAMHNECYDCSFAGACMDNVCHTNKAQNIENKFGNCPHEKSAISSLMLFHDRFDKIKYIDEE